MKFTIGRTTYTLYAVVFSDGGHFHCTLLLNGNWYRYDDLGINRTIKDQLLTMIPASSLNDAHNGTHNCVVNFCPDLNCRFQEIHYVYLFVVGMEPSEWYYIRNDTTDGPTSEDATLQTSETEARQFETLECLAFSSTQ